MIEDGVAGTLEPTHVDDTETTVPTEDGTEGSDVEDQNTTMTKNKTMALDEEIAEGSEGGHGLFDGEFPASGGSLITFSPKEAANIQPYTCTGTGTSTDADICAKFTGNLDYRECDCSYFCESGSLIQCIDDGETMEFGCSGNSSVIACLEKASEAEKEVVTSSAFFYGDNMALNAFYSGYTAALAMGAILGVQ